MPVVTIEGYLGSGYQKIGRSVAEKLGIDFVDRLILSNIAKEMNTHLGDILNLQKKPEEKSFTERITDNLLKALEKSALSGGGSDPFFGHGIENLLSSPYKDFPHKEDLVENLDFTNAIKKVINEIAKEGSVLILGRGASGVLRDDNKALKVGIYCDFDVRIDKYAKREGISNEEARNKIIEYDEGKKNYYLNIFQKEPLDPSIFNIIFNSELLPEDEIVEDICENAKKYLMKRK
ncbi:MAG: cytidylate kinase-like family protein [Chloroflexota bacterium]|nr:cytidylate kinase-like family protein [Chloroflexota bacterium]